MSQETFRKLRQMLMEKLDVCQELTDQEILETIDELILDSLRESGVSLKEKVQLRQELFYSVRKLDVLQELIEDETVTEIMVNGPDSIFVERKGKNGGNGHKTQAPNLNQRQNDHLPKAAPLDKGIHKYEARHASG